jgi:peptide chain release factor subunit 1
MSTNTMKIKNLFTVFKCCQQLQSEDKGVSISVMIPKEKDILKYSSFFSSEINQAENIKSKTTKTQTIESLNRLISLIRNSRDLFNGSENGLAFYSNCRMSMAVEPLCRIKHFSYKCDRTFEVQSLKSVSKRANFGLIVLDRDEASIALYNGETIVSQVTMDSNVAGQTKKGGQSAVRYSRIRETETLNFYYKISQTFTQMIGGDYGTLTQVFVGGLYPCAGAFAEGQGGVSALLRGKIKRPYANIMDTNSIGIRHLLKASSPHIKQVIGQELRTELDRLKWLDARGRTLTGESGLYDSVENRTAYTIYMSTKGLYKIPAHLIKLLCQGSNSIRLGDVFDSGTSEGLEFDSYYTCGFVLSPE